MRFAGMSWMVLFFASAAFAQSLTEPQKEELRQVLTSQAAWNRLFQTELKKHSRLSAEGLFPMLESGRTTPPDYQPIEDNCRITVVPPEKKGELTTPDGQKKIPQFSVTIEGPACPVSARISLDGVQAKDGFDARLLIEAAVLSAEYKKEQDVDQVRLVMDFSAHLLKETDAKDSPLTTTILLGGNGEGHSQKWGAFKQKVEFTGSIRIVPPPAGSNTLPGLTLLMGETLGYAFSDFTAELKSDLKMSGIFGPAEEHYFLNSEAVGKDDYQRFRNEIKLPLDQDPQGEPQNPGGDHPLSCRVTVYDGAVLDLATLKKAVQLGSPVTAPALLDDTRCGQTGVWNLHQGADSLMVFMSFQPQNVDLNLSLNQREQSSLSFLSDQSSDQAEQIGAYPYRLKCDPVPKCQ